MFFYVWDLLSFLIFGVTVFIKFGKILTITFSKFFFSFTSFLLLEDSYYTYSKPPSIFKGRDIILPTNVRLVRLWFFQCSCMDVRVGLQRKLSAEEVMLLNCGVGEDLRVPWTARRSNQSILKEISPGISLEGMMLKLKLQYFGHLV